MGDELFSFKKKVVKGDHEHYARCKSHRQTHNSVADSLEHKNNYAADSGG